MRDFRFAVLAKRGILLRRHRVQKSGHFAKNSQRKYQDGTADEADAWFWFNNGVWRFHRIEIGLLGMRVTGKTTK